MSSRIPSLLLAATACLMLAPAGAHAAVETFVYDVKIEDSGTADSTEVMSTQSGTLRRENTGDFTFSGVIHDVTFRNGEPVTRDPRFGNIDVIAHGERTATFTCGSGCEPQYGNCNGDLTTQVRSRIVFGDRTSKGDMFSQWIADSGGFDVSQQCSGTLYGPDEVYELEATETPIYANIELPREIPGMGQFIQEFSDEETGDQCPNRTPMTTSCELQYHGTIELRRTGYDFQPGAPAPPPPGPSPLTSAPAPAPAASQSASAAVRASRGSVSRSRSSASVKVTCRAACRGTLSAYAVAKASGGRSARAAAVSKPLAVKRFELAAGTHTVKVAFSRKARAALKKAGAVRLVVAPAGGAKTTLVVRLR